MSSTTEPIRDIFDAVGRGLQHNGLRRANERAVLTVIGFNPGVSNADIARLSGLAPQTVSAILTDIDRAGLITRGDVLRGRRGQPATPIFLKADGAYSIGVEIGWRHVEVLLLDFTSRVLVRQHRSYRFPDAHTIVDQVTAMIGEAMRDLSETQRQRLTDLGIALPTNIAANTHLVDAPADQAEAWAKLDLQAELARRTGLDVSLSNDGNAACWAELIAFPRPRPPSFIYCLISCYIAAGVVGEGMLLEGPTGNSANLGSILVTGPDGKMQPAHFIASVMALGRRLHQAGFPVADRDPQDWEWGSFGAVLDEWIADSGAALAQVIYNTTSVLECGLVVIDGIIPADVVKRLAAQVTRELDALSMQAYTAPQVLQGHLGAPAPAIGAAQLTLYRRYFSRTVSDIAG